MKTEQEIREKLSKLEEKYKYFILNGYKLFENEILETAKEINFIKWVLDEIEE